MPRNTLTPHWKNIYLFLVDKRTDWKPKALLVLAALYLLWPVDLAPDLIPFFGWLDDLGFGTIAIWYVSRAAKQYRQLPDSNKKRP